MKKSCVTLLSAFFLIAPAIAQQPAPAATDGSFKCDFESSDKLPDGWTTEGKISIDNQTAFKGGRSLVMERAAEEMEKPCRLTSAQFPVKPGLWQFEAAARSDLKSPDHSFSGIVTLEYLDKTGKVMDSVKLVDTYGRNNWQFFTKRVELPDEAATARFHVQINKASGSFWIDDLAASFISAAAKREHQIDRILFATVQFGNLIYPEDPRTVKVTVVANKPLEENQRDLSYFVSDYWGAETGAAGNVKLGEPKQTGKTFTYEAVLDLGNLALEMGRYYEVHAGIIQEGGEPFRNHTSLAILPKAATKQYQAEEIPFTNRNWDGSIVDFVRLADRLGIRMSSAANAALCKELGMGTMIGVDGLNQIEHRLPGWEKIDVKTLRQRTHDMVEKFKEIHPLLLTLGNEPPTPPDGLAPNVAAYKAVYEEAKKDNPSITVFATSVGPVEDFFKAGFHKYCDVVDFHAYSDWREIQTAFQNYDRLFAKYGHKRPVCSTEIGLNCQGLTRETVAADMIKKLSSFFSCGGTSVSWFDLGYPDPDLKLADDSTTAFNIFDCRYNRYCPKLDAVTYYNIINGICVKKRAADKVYGPDIYTFLFRDRDNHCMQVIWKEKGRQDVLLPLPGVHQVTAIDIDGRRSELDADGKSLTLTVNEDPLILLFDSATVQLADRLGAPQAELASLPENLVKGGTTSLTVKLSQGLTDQNLDLAGPALWSIKKAPSDGDTPGASAFVVGAPETTAAREGRIAIRIKDGKGGCNGELRAAIPVTGAVTVRLMPAPDAGNGSPGARLIIRNNTADRQEASWSLALTKEIPMKQGRFDVMSPLRPTAYFADAAQGVKTIDAKGTAEIVVPLAGIDPLTVYGVKAGVTDAMGRTVNTERFMAGFVRVPHARGPINLDGSMTEPDWKNAPVENISEARQYYPLGNTEKWKGTSDLSGSVRLLWDEKYLYVGVHVTDDVFSNKKIDGDIWAGDGLQFLIDPARDRDDKPGKYDISAALTQKGSEAWCYLSADGNAPSGRARDIIVSTKRLNPDRGDMTYLVAIPWSRVAPFKPGVGANLGLCVVLNEDDGPGRASFMTWFGDIQSKQVDTVGDLILGE